MPALNAVLDRNPPRRSMAGPSYNRMQGWESEWDGVGWDPTGGDPWEPKGIPWEGTHGSGNPWEPKGIPREGVPDPPWEGNAWEPKGSHGRGPLGIPLGGLWRSEDQFGGIC